MQILSVISTASIHHQQHQTLTPSTMPPKKEHTDNNSSSSSVGSTAAFMSAEQKQLLYAANAKLCRLVKRCPWMYDRQHPSYAKKHIVDKSWMKIAKDCDDSVASCKERWRNIRAAFARSINIYKTSCGPNRVKPYYLYNDLTFLIKPMTDGRDTTHRFPEDIKCDREDTTTPPPPTLPPTLPSMPPSMLPPTLPPLRIIQRAAEEASPRAITQRSPEKLPEAANDASEHLILSEEDAEKLPEVAELDAVAELPDVNQDVINSMIDSSHTRNFQQATPLADSTRIAGHSVESLSNGPPSTGHDFCSSSAADAKFLETLLPEMRAMNARQKIVFKRKIYQSLEEVFESNADFPRPAQSNAATQSITSPGIRAATTAGQALCSSKAQSMMHSIANLKESDMQKLQDFLRKLLNQTSSAATETTSNSSLQPMTAHMVTVNPRVLQPGNSTVPARGDGALEPLRVKNELIDNETR